MIGPEYSSMTEWERQKEWKEFTHAARVYQPLTTSLASKFTRAQAVEDKEERPKVLKFHDLFTLQYLTSNKKCVL